MAEPPKTAGIMLLNNPLMYTDPSGWNYSSLSLAEILDMLSGFGGCGGGGGYYGFRGYTSFGDASSRPGIFPQMGYYNSPRNNLEYDILLGMNVASSDGGTGYLRAVSTTVNYFPSNYSGSGVTSYKNVAYFNNGKIYIDNNSPDYTSSITGEMPNSGTKRDFGPGIEIGRKVVRLWTFEFNGGDWFDKIKSGITSAWNSYTEVNKYKLNDRQAEAVLYHRARGWDNLGIKLTIGGAVAGGGATIILSRLTWKVSIPSGLLLTALGLAANLRASSVEGDHWDMYRRYINSENRNGLYIIDRTTTMTNQGMAITCGTTYIYLPNGTLFGSINY